VNSKNILIILAVFVLMTCVCPICVAFTFVGIENIGGESLRDAATMLFLAVLCFVPLSLAVVGGGWQLWYTFRSRVAGRRLAEALGLTPLNESPKQMAIWYGGEFQGRPFAIKPIGTTYRYYGMDRSRTGVNFLLRIVMTVQTPRPLGVVVYRGATRAKANPQNFDDAFDQQNADRLSAQAQAALFEFVQKGYRTGLTGVTFRMNKGARNLRLRDRVTAPDGLLAPEALPDAPVILVHDHPDTTISGEELQALLADMAAVTRAVEASA
jgi:hypothetical protein